MGTCIIHTAEQFCQTINTLISAKRSEFNIFHVKSLKHMLSCVQCGIFMAQFHLTPKTNQFFLCNCRIDKCAASKHLTVFIFFIFCMLEVTDLEAEAQPIFCFFFKCDALPCRSKLRSVPDLLSAAALVHPRADAAKTLSA